MEEGVERSNRAGLSIPRCKLIKTRIAAGSRCSLPLTGSGGACAVSLAAAAAASLHVTRANLSLNMVMISSGTVHTSRIYAACVAAFETGLARAGTLSTRESRELSRSLLHSEMAGLLVGPRARM